jgi:pyruvate ferredoxin oxidoreductase gamma subunit
LTATQKVFTLPATKISIDEIGRALPNAPMMGAFVKAVPIMSIEDLLREIRTSFEGKFPEKIIEGNLSAIRRGYEEAISDV